MLARINRRAALSTLGASAFASLSVTAAADSSPEASPIMKLFAEWLEAVRVGEVHSWTDEEMEAITNRQADIADEMMQHDSANVQDLAAKLIAVTIWCQSDMNGWEDAFREEFERFVGVTKPDYRALRAAVSLQA